MLVNVKVENTGNTVIENWTLKAEAIYEAVGDKKVRYCGEQYSKPGNLGVSGEIATYTYEIRDHEDANLLTNMVEAAEY